MVESRAELTRKNSHSLFTDMENRAELARRNSHSLFEKDQGQSAPSLIKILYHTGWAKPHFHYRSITGDSTWTQLPGTPCVPVGNDVFSIEVEAEGIEFVCNDGVPGAWDKAPGDQNYFIRSPGKYKLQNGRIERLAPPPKAPAFIVAGEVGNTSVALSWNPPEGIDPADIGCYHVYRDGALVHKASGGQTLTWVDSGLKGGMTYSYEVSSLNVQGSESQKCTPAQVTTNVPGKPGAPAWLKVARHGADFVELTWKPPQDLGGASVTAYRIFRGAPDANPAAAECVDTLIARDASTGRDRDVLEWRDKNVTQGQEYSYQVSALHMPEAKMGKSVSQAQLVELIRKQASQSLLAVTESENEGPPCAPVTAKAVASLKVPRIGDKEPHIMLQAFNWSSCFNKSGWYNVIRSKAAQLQEAGIDMAWLPPPSDCVDARGYLPREWYNLNSKYGSEAELRALIQDFHSVGIVPVADVVVNHRCASKQDNDGKWTSFRNPDWERWAICGNDPSGLGQGAQSTGTNIEYAPDIDHTNRKIQEDVMHYMKWLMEDVGFRSIRMDFVLGYGPWFQEQYIRSVGTPYAVSEYWHGDVNVLKNYVNATKGISAVYDFPVYYTLKNAIRSNDFSSLDCGGKLPGLMGCDPVRSVTFVENHDTSHLEVVGGMFGDNNQVTRAYAFLLTHCGIPSIFWSDWSDRGEEVTRKLTELCQVRNSIGVHSTSRVSINAAQGGLFASYVDGERGTIAFKMGSNDWCPHGSGWNLKTAGNDYAVWTKGR